MQADLQALRQLAALSVRDPRSAARWLMAQDIPAAARWMLLGLVSVASTIMLNLEIRADGAELGQVFGAMVERPILAAVLQAAALLLMVAAVHRVGLIFGGRGTFADTMLLVGWIQLLLVAVSVVQVVLLVAFPLLSGLVGLAAMALFLWLFVNFVAELHGFDSIAKVALGSAITLILAGFLLSLLLAPLMPAPMGV